MSLWLKTQSLELCDLASNSDYAPSLLDSLGYDICPDLKARMMPVPSPWGSCWESICHTGGAASSVAAVQSFK